MLTDNEKKLVRMMVVNTTPEYMAEVGAMDDNAVRLLIEDFRTKQLAIVTEGLRFNSEHLSNVQEAIDKLTAVKSQLEA